MSLRYLMPSKWISSRSSYKYFLARDRVPALRVRVNAGPFVVKYFPSFVFLTLIKSRFSRSSIFSSPFIILLFCLDKTVADVEKQLFILISSYSSEKNPFMQDMKICTKSSLIRFRTALASCSWKNGLNSFT